MHAPEHLTCNSCPEPQGVDSPEPRLGWWLPGATQGAWQVRLEALRTEGWRQLWDSGRVDSPDSVGVAYAGPELESLTRYRWRVRCWSESGEGSEWSAPAHFLTGVLDPGEWRAAWISSHEQPPPEPADFSVQDSRNSPVFPEDSPALHLRRSIELDRAPEAAVLVWCGPGYCEMLVNGSKPFDEVLSPPFTDYTQRVLYRTADVTGLIGADGKAVLGAILGNGFYNMQVPDTFRLDRAPWRQSPRLLAELHLAFADGSREVLRTDSSWRHSTGAIRFNCLRGGETIDARSDLGEWTAPDYDDSAWQQAIEVAAPGGRLCAQEIPPIRVAETLAPVEVRTLDDGRLIADFGGNLMGWTSLELAGRAGQCVTLRHGEALGPDGSLDRKHAASHTHGRYQEQKCIASGRSYRFEPRFTYHGFRYVEAEGLKAVPAAGQWTARHAHSDLPMTGSFECSDSNVNRLHQAARRTLLDCAFYSPTAEAVREKIAWNGDNVFCLRSFFSMFDSAALYRKAVRDAIDAQEESGHALPVTPSGGWGRADCCGGRTRCDDPCWSGSFVEMAAELYSWYGDREVLEEACDPALRYLDYLSGTAVDGLIAWSLGDWKDREWSWAEGPGLTPVPATGTLTWFRLAAKCAWICGQLGRDEDARRCNRLAAEIRDRFNARFVTPGGRVSTGSQTAQALALFYDVLEPGMRTAAFEKLVRAMREADGHITAGFMGTMPVLCVLSDMGRADLAWEAITRPSGSGWIWQLEGERPTLAEAIHPHDMGNSSTHHHQFSACVAGWLYACPGGIRQDRDHPGFERFFIRPVFPPGLDRVQASIESPRGTVEVEWQRAGRDRAELRFAVPGNSRARLLLPAGTRLAEGGGSAQGTDLFWGPGEHHIELTLGRGQ